MGNIPIGPQTEVSEGVSVDDMAAVAEDLANYASEQTAKLDEATKALGGLQEAARAYLTLYYYERNYRVIYLSQLQLLSYLNSEPAGATAQQLDGFYQWHMAQVRVENPLYLNTKQQYLGFLVDSWLVSLEGDRYHITPWGKGFLEYLTRNAIPMTQPFKRY